MFYSPPSLSKAAFHCCACPVHPAQELQPAGSCAAPELGLHQGLGSKAVCSKVFISLRDELSKLHKCSGLPFHSGYLCRVNLRATPTTPPFLELGIESQQCQEMQRVQFHFLSIAASPLLTNAIFFSKHPSDWPHTVPLILPILPHPQSLPFLCASSINFPLQKEDGTCSPTNL